MKHEKITPSGFALVPDNSVPRVVRFLDFPASTNGTRKLVSVLDQEKNILRVDRALFEMLEKSQQEEVLRTHELSIEFEHFAKAEPSELIGGPLEEATHNEEQWTDWPEAAE